MLLCRILSLHSCVCSDLSRQYSAGSVGGMACLVQWIVRQLRRREPYEQPVCVFATAPLIGDVGEVSPPVVFANCCVQAGQALGIATDTVLDVQQVDGLTAAPAQVSDMQVFRQPSQEFDHRGGRYITAPYTGTFYVQGAKWYCRDSGRLKIAVSTSASTRLSEYRLTVPYSNFAVYTSWLSNHNVEDQGGMDHWPTFTTCDAHPSMFGDAFFHVRDMHRLDCMEDVLESDGIADYHRFICGFHIHGIDVSHVDPALCPLDWYYQTDTQRIRDPDVWDHYLLLDQVSPVDFWKAEVLRSIGQYSWPTHRIGGDASWCA